jgi:hypothetical protein
MKTSAGSPGRAGLILLLTGQMLPLIDTSITSASSANTRPQIGNLSADSEKRKRLIMRVQFALFDKVLAPFSSRRRTRYASRVS